VSFLETGGGTDKVPDPDLQQPGIPGDLGGILRRPARGGLRYYAALTEELAASGELIVSEALAEASLAKRVSVRDGQTLTSDGPFAETKELLGGFFLLDCESIERAVEIAARVPEAELGLVEVRPLLDLGGMEL
jgi:hypothetical protein